MRTSTILMKQAMKAQLNQPNEFHYFVLPIQK
jgi:hypothetical protein